MATKKFKCKVCGYVHEGDKAPEKCPVCQAPASEFEEITEDAPAKKKGLNTNSNTYTIVYAAVMVIVVAFLLAFVNASLKSKQEENIKQDTKKQILAALNIREVEDVNGTYSKVVKEDRLITPDGELGEVVDDKDFATSYEKEVKDNNRVHIFVCDIDGQTKYVIPVYGVGLWGAIWGYVALNDEGAETGLYGIYISDKNQVVDNFSYIDHVSPRCRSNEHFKGVLDDAATANFSGCIRVRPDAQKTEAYQANNNLLISDTARVNSKPQLVIDADDVKCSHGATVGQIDEEAMFYLRSRGIGLEEARMMMMFGFAHDIIQRVKLDPLREQIDMLVEKRLRGELSKCYNCMFQCRK